jgi:hypothetical protein
MLLEEADRNDLSREKLSVLWRGLAEGLDRVMARVGEEFQHELDRRRKVVYDGTNQVRRLLRGEVKEAGELRYCLSGWHLALICVGPDSRSTLRECAGELDRALLLVSPSEDLSWAWLGGHRPFNPRELDALLAPEPSDSTVIACGEPGSGLSGWRLSHHQATSAMVVARSSPTGVVCYSEVALVAAALRDEVLARTLRNVFVEPLSLDRDSGRAAKATLRAYFDASRNISSTAAALGVTRRTVANRLAAAESRLGKSLSRFAGEIQTALRLDELENQTPSAGDRRL